MRLNGGDASDEPIDFLAGKDVVGIEIELIGRAAALTARCRGRGYNRRRHSTPLRDSLRARSEG